MVLNRKLFQKICEQRKSYLVYLISSCEMGSEGWSGWDYYAIAHGDTDEEIFNDWAEQCKNIYGVDFSEDLKYQNGKWYCYYEFVKSELPKAVYGVSKPLLIKECYERHTG